MLKIGEFSALSHLTVKALRYYEAEGILSPAMTDARTGYRYYETDQLRAAAAVKAYRQLGLSLEQIKAVSSGADVRSVLCALQDSLRAEKTDLELRLSILRSMLEEPNMKYQVTRKDIPEKIVYSCEATLPKRQDIMRWIPSVGAACVALNPKLKCDEPPYEFCEYLDGEYKEEAVRVRHSEAVCAFGVGDENITFHTLPACRVLSLYHKGSYDTIAQAYAFLYEYAKQNGYSPAAPARECYVDGIWNKESPEEWLTEIQLPIL